MKLCLQDVEAVMDYLYSAMVYAREARHEARKVYSKDEAVTQHMKYVYADIENAAKIIRGEA